MIVADAITALGHPYADARTGDLVIVQFRGGRPIHRTMETAADLPLTTDTYLATGAFRAGSITSGGGRTVDNLTAILSLPFDCDLSDYTGLDKADLHAMPDDDLDALIGDLCAFARQEFGAIGLVPNRVDVTGYGVALHVNIAPQSQSDIAELRELHRRIGQAVNRHAGLPLVDEQALDAGTRIMRLPPSPNTKRTDRPRVARTLHNDEGAHDTAALRAVCEALGGLPEPVRRIVPSHGRELSPDSERRVVDAMSGAWSAGQRHAVALGLAGWLAKSGIPQSQTMRIVAALSAGDGDEVRDRERAVATTYRHVESGSDAAGYTSLRQRLPAAVLAAVDDVLSAYRHATAPTLVIGSGRLERTPPVYRIAPLPDAVFYGALGEYVELAAPTTEAADQFHVGAFLAMLSVEAGRRFANLYSSKNLYCNLFVMLVGATGSSRKDTAMDRARDVVDMAATAEGVTLRNRAWMDLSDVSSGEGLIQMLADAPDRLLMLSELTAMLSKAERKGSESILDLMIAAYDCKRLENNTKVSPIRAETPYLVALAATQPERLGRAFSTNVVTSGFGNRWLLIPGEGKDAMPEPPCIDRRRAGALWRRVTSNMDALAHGAALPVMVAFDDRAKPVWTEYYNAEHDATRAPGQDDTIVEMRQRRPVQVRKIASLLAVSEGSDVITPEMLDAALALVNWSWSETVKLIELWNPSVESRIERRVIDVLASNGAMSNARLQQVTRNRAWSASEYNRVVKALVEIGTLVRDADNVIALGAIQ